LPLTEPGAHDQGVIAAAPSVTVHRRQGDRRSGDEENGDDVGRSAFRKKEFCERNGISLAYFYLLRSQGRGPREMSIGRVTLDAERDWQREREAEAQAKQAACQPLPESKRHKQNAPLAEHRAARGVKKIGGAK
jgi:hypothetical protein